MHSQHGPCRFLFGPAAPGKSARVRLLVLLLADCQK